jgi:hypothetical protein
MGSAKRGLLNYTGWNVPINKSWIGKTRKSRNERPFRAAGHCGGRELG